ncbi:MAG TPA: DegT/DnrJ/EryC1/StrS aminotransferase family protein [Gaiellaceae bacterium]|nr:DegT/DnrJ/EryC1/StrS aminotransferase family protein [Gaiellaceae bacterium]
MIPEGLPESRVAIEGGKPTRDKFLPFGAPAIGEEEIAEVVATLRSGWIGQGARVERFEREFAAAVGAAHAVAVSSCTAALHLSLVARGLRPGDEVLVPALTFAATATAVEHAAGVPVLCDVDPETLLIDLEDAERRVTRRTRSIVPVHFGGLPCPLDDVMHFADAHSLTVVEDAAHAVGARLNGRPIGSFDTLCCFSFYANKNLTTGEGGMITLRDGKVAERVRMLRLHGLSTDAWRRYSTKSFVPSELCALGFKYNLTDIQAAIGIHQLAKLERHQRRREELAALYDGVLGEFPGVSTQPRTLSGASIRHALHLYLLVLDPDRFSVGRDEIVAAIRAENVGAAVHYRPLHLEPYFTERLGHAPEDFPNALEAGRRVLTLPLSPGMSDEDADDVVHATLKVLRRYAHR